MKIKGTLWITTTAVLIAMLIVVQVVTGPMGQLVTGSLVNLILIVSVMVGGLSSGLTVALISHVAARLLGIGPEWGIVPFVMAGNAVLVIVWHVFGKMKFANKHILRCTALVIGAVCKFAVLYTGIVLIAVPLLLNLPEKQAAVVTGLFSFPQLFTALIGGAIAAAILPILEKMMNRK